MQVYNEIYKVCYLCSKCCACVLKGQAKVFALIPSVQEEEVFVLLEGSTLLHVLQTRVHNMLYFIVPGEKIE